MDLSFGFSNQYFSDNIGLLIIIFKKKTIKNAGDEILTRFTGKKYQFSHVDLSSKKITTEAVAAYLLKLLMEKTISCDSNVF